jgi:hypothetical protein
MADIQIQASILDIPAPAIPCTITISDSDDDCSEGSDDDDSDSDDDDDDADTDDDDSECDDSGNDEGDDDVNPIGYIPDFERSEIIHNFEVKSECVKFAVPENMSESELSFSLRKSSCMPQKYEGFKFHSKSDILKMEYITSLIKMRTELLMKFHESKKQCRLDAEGMREFSIFFMKIEERLMEQFKILSSAYDITLEEKPLKTLMDGVAATNSCSYSSSYAITGKVKSYAKYIPDLKSLPSPLSVLCIILQHIVLYNVTFGKGKHAIYYLIYLFN